MDITSFLLCVAEWHICRRSFDGVQNRVVRLLRYAQSGVGVHPGSNEPIIAELFDGGVGAVAVRRQPAEHGVSAGKDVLSLCVSFVVRHLLVIRHKNNCVCIFSGAALPTK